MPRNRSEKDPAYVAALALLQALQACIKMCDDAGEPVSTGSWNRVPGLREAWRRYTSAWGVLMKADPESRYREPIKTYRGFAEELSIKLGITHATQP